MAPPGVGGISALVGGALIVGCFVAAFGGAHLAVLMKAPAADLTPKTRCVGSQRIGACHRLGPAHAESPWMGGIPPAEHSNFPPHAAYQFINTHTDHRTPPLKRQSCQCTTHKYHLQPPHF